jgi:uncharacterized protein (TIGR02453 family)
MNEEVFKIIKFLNELSQNNSKQWMDLNRQRYLECKSDWIKIINETIEHIYSFDPSIGLLDPKDTLFRINRDIRFSHNKLPYNTHFSAVIARGGRKSPYAGYYIHLDQSGSLTIGGGIWEPEPEVLGNIRRYIDDKNNSSKLKKILKDPTFVSIYSGLSDYKGKKAPRGFEKSLNPEFMLYKNFVVMSNSIVSHDLDLLSVIKDRTTTIYPFLNYLNQGLVFIK